MVEAQFLRWQFKDVSATEANLKTFPRWCCLCSEGHVPVFLSLFFVLGFFYSNRYSNACISSPTSDALIHFTVNLKRQDEFPLRIDTLMQHIPLFLHNSCLDTWLVFQCGSCCCDVLTFERVIWLFVLCSSRSNVCARQERKTDHWKERKNNILKDRTWKKNMDETRFDWLKVQPSVESLSCDLQLTSTHTISITNPPEFYQGG